MAFLPSLWDNATQREHATNCGSAPTRDNPGTFREFDRKGLSAEERGKAIGWKYGKAR